MRAKNVLVTGRPGAGKSTLVAELVKEAKESGLRVGGLSTPEIRERGMRAGFKLVDIASGEEGVLAHVEQREGPRVSKYRVNLDDLRRVGAGAIRRGVKECDVVVIDEVGKMELFSDEFKEAVLEALASDKRVLATIGMFLRDPFARKILSREDVRLFELSRENRGRTLKEIRLILFDLGTNSSDGS